jgi:hypothetical protein
VGVNPITFLSMAFLLRYFRERTEFRKLGGKVDTTYPILSDYRDWAGSMQGHYFHQDLYVAQAIFSDQPGRHVDVGSSISGFVSHVASFMPIEILDIRPVPSSSKNISFTQQDVMKGLSIRTSSLSCLHTIEHFGLGRYGDPINPEGHIQGFINLVAAVERGGKFYISFPIGSKERVEFNAHRVFHPETIFSWPSSQSLRLLDFAWVDDSGSLHPNSSVSEAVSANLHYGCGIYTFEKT